jgi:hypothetical protein
MTTDIRVGDRFLIEVEVVDGRDDTWRACACVPAVGIGALVPALWLLNGKRLPRAIRVGDRVGVPAPPPEPRGTREAGWNVVALDGEWAWCRKPSSESGWLFRLSDLTLCDEASS